MEKDQSISEAVAVAAIKTAFPEIFKVKTCAKCGKSFNDYQNARLYCDGCLFKFVEQDVG